MFTFVENWKEIIARAWSVRILVLSYVLFALADLWPFLGGSISPWIFLAIGVPLAVVARVVDQKNLDG